MKARFSSVMHRALIFPQAVSLYLFVLFFFLFSVRPSPGLLSTDGTFYASDGAQTHPKVFLREKWVGVQKEEKKKGFSILGKKKKKKITLPFLVIQSSNQ